MHYEVFVYVFDAALIFVAMVWMNWFHPSEIGLLLRGQEPITNGLQLLRPGRSSRSKGYIAESGGSTIELQQQYDTRH
jgi:hypothetical protein